jgi:AraC-like DNA-binding protein
LHGALLAHVEAVWVQEPTAAAGSAGEYVVLPKPCSVVGFQYRGRLSVVRDSGARLLAPSGITGLQSTVRRFQGDADTRSVIVALRPHGAFALFGCASNDLADQHVPLEALLPGGEVRAARERVWEADGTVTTDSVVQRFLLECLRRFGREVHAVVMEAVGAILESRGTVGIEQLGHRLGVSRRQLERLFKVQVGVGPKELASLARFERVVETLPRRRSWADLACDAGYADQAHLIRSFSRRAGVTPAQYVRAMSPG